jgi:hypothetical protein
MIPSEIQNAIDNNGLVVFVGSGLSKRFNLPTWEKLTEDIIKDINESKFFELIPPLKSRIFSPIEILDRIKSEHFKVSSYIKTNFKVDSNQDFSLHKKILELTNAVITTNYDNAFEEASFNSIIPTKYTSSFNISEINKANTPYIFKIHGCYTEPDNCIIFSEQYKKLYDGDTASKEKLKAIFIDKTIVFVGFSFNDPDINLIFTNLNNLFEGNIRHFILTMEVNDFDKFRFLKTIPIQDYDSSVNDFFDDCIVYKKKLLQISDKKNGVKGEIKKNKARIAILRPKPLDIIFDSEIYSIESCIDDLDIELYLGYLNKRTLESIDDFDILIVATKVFKNKLYIEDDNLNSDLLTSLEIFNHIPNEKIPIIIITNEKIELVPNFNTINISTYKRATIRKFAYKALRNNDLNFSANEEISIGLSTLEGVECNKGSALIKSIYSNNRLLDIGEKSLKNIIGRIEEQSIIASKLINVIRNNKVFNIKASGGTGKTTLIKKVAYELYNRGYFKEGISFKSCENVRNYIDFEEQLCEALSLRNISNLKEYLIENYSSKKSDSLIILDNFETVSNSLPNSEFKQVIELIKFVSEYSNIAITSREKISSLEDYEDLYSLSPLTTDDAVLLFELDYGKVVNETEVRILRQEILEELLNNNPLAIKLVTKSRTRFAHISELRDQIKEHFFESVNEDYSIVFMNNADLNIERTKSIYQSINYSYTTLKNKEKISFELLSLFPDGISLSNFKKCFEKSISSNAISDKEFRILRDKSLVEDYNGTLQLQPIIRRFAEHQFSKREVEAKKKYCSDAYLFNCYVLDIIEFVERKKNISEALKIFTHYKNNLLNVFSYIPDIEIEKNSPIQEKKYLLNYIYALEDFVVNEKQIQEFYKKLNSIREFFTEIPFADKLIDVILLNKQYYFEEFENSYIKLSHLFSSEDLEKRNFKSEEYLERRYKNIISNIHSMEGFTINRIKSYISNDDYSSYLDANFFYLGIPNTISRKKHGFYFFEYELMLDRLNNIEIELYIDTLHQEEHLEIMQSTYTLSKIKRINKKQINKLVVTNPYTKGLKDLMLAFESEISEEKVEYFKSALKNLYHIKYYYLEAVYFYCKYLKETNNPKYSSLLIQGLELSKKYYYQYINHLFDNLKNNINTIYDFNFSFYQVTELEKYVIRHNEEWKKTFKERELLL